MKLLSNDYIISPDAITTVEACDINNESAVQSNIKLATPSYMHHQRLPTLGCYSTTRWG